MQIEYIDIDKIKPYNNNPRRNEYAIDYVEESIKQFGFKVPITVDKNYVIITGHTRYEACKRLKYKKIPCIIVDDLDDNKIKAFRLADNKVNEIAVWDEDKLKEELKKIEKINMELLGFITQIEDFDWESIKDLSEELYEEPEVKTVQCPYCNHIDSKVRFKKV